MTNNQTADYKAKAYVYDLDNCAKEFGYKQDENWELSEVSDNNKKAIEKKYYHTVSIKAFPEMLAELFHIVKTRLTQLNAGVANSAIPVHVPPADLQFLVTYNPKRQRP